MKKMESIDVLYSFYFTKFALNKKTTFLIYAALFFCVVYFTQTGTKGKLIFAQNIALTSQTEPQGEADSLFREMLSSVEGAISVSASIRQQINLFGTEFHGLGSYHELKTPELHGKEMTRFRLELQIQSPATAKEVGSPNSITIVCDRTYKYIYRYISLEDEKFLERIEIKRLTDALEATRRSDIPMEVGSMFGLGGLAGMLREMRKRYDFLETPIRTQIGEENNKINVRKIRGQLKPALAKSLTETVANAKKQKIPNHIPTTIDVFIGDDDRFPFRFDYFWTADASPPSAERFGYLLFYNQVLHDPISETMFDYFPSENLSPTDVTDQVISRMLER
ncbi:MAG: hypothetical protein LBJ67_02435 [Planctomycetaceae bacterium]|jgi:hypothetical protein|nr:hypothetical protein [Planctomycetaceae bacterium]